MDLFKDIIPAQALGIQVDSFDGLRIVLSAPLDLNINDKGTGFAGSISSMLSLAGWGVITASLNQRDIAADVMVVKSELVYSAAVKSDLKAEAVLSADELDRILDELEQRGRSRVQLSAILHDDERCCAEMTASYAVLQR